MRFWCFVRLKVCAFAICNGLIKRRVEKGRGESKITLNVLIDVGPFIMTEATNYLNY